MFRIIWCLTIGVDFGIQALGLRQILDLVKTIQEAPQITNNEKAVWSRESVPKIEKSEEAREPQHTKEAT